jgi:hypothetical protein
LTGISILALGLIIGTLLTPAISAAESNLEPIDNRSLEPSADAAPEPEISDSTDSVGFVREAESSDLAAEENTQADEAPEQQIPETHTTFEESEPETHTTFEEESTESTTFESTNNGGGETAPLGTNGDEELNVVNDPLSTDKIALVLDGNEDNDVLEVTVDLADSQILSIPEGIVAFKVRDDEDKAYNIESEITFVYDESLFLIKPHFEELGCDEAVKCIILQFAVEGIIRVLKPIINLGDLRIGLVAGIVKGILLNLPTMIYLGLNEYDFSILIDDIKTFIEEWDNPLEELINALPDALESMMIKLFDKFTLETDGNPNDEFLMPGISAKLKTSIPDGVYDIDIIAQSGICNAEQKTIRLTVINGGQQGSQSQEEIVEEQVVLEGTQSTTNL